MLLASLVILKWFPDTKGLSLEECARVFGDEEELFGSGRKDEEGGQRRMSKEAGREGEEMIVGE